LKIGLVLAILKELQDGYELFEQALQALSDRKRPSAAYTVPSVENRLPAANWHPVRDKQGSGSHERVQLLW